MGIEAVFGLDKKWQPDLSCGGLAKFLLAPGSFTALFYGYHLDRVRRYADIQDLPSDEHTRVEHGIKKIYRMGLSTGLFFDALKLGTQAALLYAAVQVAQNPW